MDSDLSFFTIFKRIAMGVGFLQGMFSAALLNLQKCPEQLAVLFSRLVGTHLLADYMYLCPKLVMESPFWEQGQLSELVKKWHILVCHVDGFNRCFHHNLLGGHHRRQLISGTLDTEFPPQTFLIPSQYFKHTWNSLFLRCRPGVEEGMTFNQSPACGRVEERARAFDCVSHASVWKESSSMQ